MDMFSLIYTPLQVYILMKSQELWVLNVFYCFYDRHNSDTIVHVVTGHDHDNRSNVSLYDIHMHCYKSLDYKDNWGCLYIVDTNILISFGHDQIEAAHCNQVVKIVLHI